MLNITVIAVGKMKEDYFRAACAEYAKRIGAYAKIKIVELAEERLPDNPSPKEIEAALANEGKAVLSMVPSGSAVIALCIEGKELASEELSARLDKFAIDGKSSVCFIIGSSCGLSEDVKKAAHIKLSMSRMTFPHRLARVMVLEQIYRALSISAGSKYHK